MDRTPSSAAPPDLASRSCFSRSSPDSPPPIDRTTSVSFSSTTRAAQRSATAPACRTPLGLVTDLDEHLTARALDSLTAELRRRERLLAEAGAKDLEDYRALPSTSGVDHPRLARLVIVVDEFKMLADELPDFVNGLVRIAATGRSLGVHLVLATQRPAGIITGDMRSTSPCASACACAIGPTATTSSTMRGAATLSEAAPGRAYLRAGDGQLIALQTAHVGGPVDEPGSRQHVTVSLLGGDGPPGSRRLPLSRPARASATQPRRGRRSWRPSSTSLGGSPRRWTSSHHPPRGCRRCRTGWGWTGSQT